MVVTRGRPSVNRREPGPGVAYGTKSSSCTPPSEHESCLGAIRVVFGTRLGAYRVGDDGRIGFDTREPGPGVENGKASKERLDLSSAEYSLGSKRHFWGNLTNANYRPPGSHLHQLVRCTGKDQAERQRLVHLRHQWL
jgi:hypothetical protein